MGIRDNFLFPKNSTPIPSSGDGGPGGIKPSGGLSTTGALGDESAHGDIDSFRRAQAMSSGVGADGGSAGFSLGGPATDEFDTYGGTSVNNDAGASGYGIAGQDSLVTRGEISPDSNMTAGGTVCG